MFFNLEHNARAKPPPAATKLKSNQKIPTAVSSVGFAPHVSCPELVEGKHRGANANARHRANIPRVREKMRTPYPALGTTRTN